MANKMASPTTTFNNTLQQNHHLLSSITLCKYPSFSFKSHYYLSRISNISSLKHPFPQCLRNSINSKFSSTEHKPHSTKTMKSPPVEEFGHGFSHLRSRNERVGRKAKSSSVVEEKIERKFIKDGYVRKDVESRRNREMGEVGTEVSSLKSIHKRVEMKVEKDKVSPLVDEEMVEIKKSRSSSQLGRGKKDRGSNKVKGDNQVGELKKSKKIKVDSPELQLRIGLDMCSKNGDFLSAVSLYDSAQRDNIQLGQYHYTVLLYLCSSAAVGIVRPAKSGSGSRSVDKVDFGSEISTVDDNFDGQVDAKAPHGEFLVKEGSRGVSVYNGCTPRGNSEDGFIEGRQGSSEQGECEIQVPEDVKRYALTRGFEIYEKMCSENIPLNEATLTSVARMAMSMGNGDMAFEMVKQMKDLGMKPRLRSYGPALFTYCNSGDIEKAFMVEEHMLENGIYPEEPELEALLRLSVRAGRGDKVYYLLHKLRTSLRQVSRSTADVIIVWFRSKEASRVGQRKWDLQLITEAMENGGGGWHGQGWLGKGKWTIAHALVGSDGVCESCGDKLVTIDLDPTETENFAKSVAAIAAKRERFSDFENFQKWLDYYGPFEAVVDAANVGLFSQRNFVPAKVNLIVNGIRQKLPSKKWPLIVLHNKRITGGKMIQPANRMLLEKWKNADALYATPTGSNDDWYWLYAAIKFKCLLVTNDEMRDHVFQLLGNDFFPRWKERHQVRFSFRDGGPEFHMPPPCSVVIQESSKGHWHIPIVSEHVSERERTWLCVTRGSVEKKDSSTNSKEGDPDNEDCVYEHTQFRRKMKLHGAGRMIQQNTRDPKDFFSTLRSILSQTVAHSHRTLLSDIEAAEKLGGCVIDFQI